MNKKTNIQFKKFHSNKKFYILVIALNQKKSKIKVNVQV